MCVLKSQPSIKVNRLAQGGLNLPSAETLYVVTPNHKIILLLLHYCNFSAARNCNIRYIWYAGYLTCGPVKRSFEPPRGGNPQVENPWTSHMCLTYWISLAEVDVKLTNRIWRPVMCQLHLFLTYTLWNICYTV